MSDLLQRVTELAQAAKKAARVVALASTETRNRALQAAAQALRESPVEGWSLPQYDD